MRKGLPLNRSDAPEATTGDTSATAEISRQLVRIHASHWGRGPTKAKTIWQDDVVVCVLSEIFTRAEETLVESGHFDQVRQNRQAFQDVMEPRIREVVEAATGRQVAALLSQISPEGVAAVVLTLSQPPAP